MFGWLTSPGVWPSDNSKTFSFFWKTFNVSFSLASGFLGSVLDPFALLRGAPCAVTRCFLRYHLFFTTYKLKVKVILGGWIVLKKFTFSHMVQATPWDWMWTLTMCCFKLKLFEKVFQQYSQTLGCIHRHLFLGWVAWGFKLLGPPPPSPGFPPSPSWFGYEPWIFSSCWAGMGSRIRTRDWITIIWVFHLSGQDPFAPYQASSVLLKCHRC